MSHGARGLIFIMNERHENWRRTADQELLEMYRRPDAEPLPPEPEPIPRRWLRVPSLLRRPSTSANAKA
jgi:hypothetical protein